MAPSDEFARDDDKMVQVASDVAICTREVSQLQTEAVSVLTDWFGWRDWETDDDRMEVEEDMLEPSTVVRVMRVLPVKMKSAPVVKVEVSEVNVVFVMMT